jgi:hypothetical protein
LTRGWINLSWFVHEQRTRELRNLTQSLFPTDLQFASNTFSESGQVSFVLLLLHEASCREKDCEREEAGGGVKESKRGEESKQQREREGMREGDDKSGRLKK